MAISTSGKGVFPHDSYTPAASWPGRSSLAKDERTAKRVAPMTPSRASSSSRKPRGHDACISLARKPSRVASAAGSRCTKAGTSGQRARKSTFVTANPGGVANPRSASQASERALPPKRASSARSSARKDTCGNLPVCHYICRALLPSPRNTQGPGTDNV